jgi:hypothetical protein
MLKERSNPVLARYGVFSQIEFTEWLLRIMNRISKMAEITASQ